MKLRYSEINIGETDFSELAIYIKGKGELKWRKLWSISKSKAGAPSDLKVINTESFCQL
ncbi:hypothetical protein VCHA43P277_130077 [Vibrio chagasii]|nr:hypothetical protein VCHA34P126_120077 [Vibrio chagasii]CAH6818943.1 hypothetical protein VCHA36P161_130092 [Vibrio chagasii]CAH6937381.1 hypothetical protein VCHA43P277_130077 [Vibrio chagasii]CAH6968400.1 hypothetical protein VCHA41O247_120079 [Vibrio chagasii]CAH7213358.1 hypothetical protein VCHA50P420_140092 [Vibrio chagasii]